MRTHGQPERRTLNPLLLIAGTALLAIVLLVSLSVWRAAREEAPGHAGETPTVQPHRSDGMGSQAEQTRGADDPAALRAYADPVTGGSIPLLFVEGLEDEYLSPNFRIEDLMARDGASYARISRDLVKTLEHVRWLAGVPIYVSSAYRHPAHNAAASVGGVPHSQHLAGLAADIWSPDKTPGELAEIALDVTECSIGIGLGQDFLHVDLRGHLATWAQPDAATDEATFDAWVQARCTALSTDTSALPPFSEAIAPPHDAAPEPNDAGDDLIATYRDVMAAFAEVQHKRHGPGAVILDLRPDTSSGDALPYRLSYALPGSDAARAWALDALIRSVPTATSFAFAIIQPDSSATVGAARYSPP